MQSNQLILFFLFLFLLTISSTMAEMGSPTCDPSWLAAEASDCVGGLDKPRLPCCEMVVASVGIGFGSKVPCLCLVVRELDFLATGLDIHKILKMYPVCLGALPVGPHTADACRGWASLSLQLLLVLFDNVFIHFLCSLRHFLLSTFVYENLIVQVNLFFPRNQLMVLNWAVKRPSLGTRDRSPWNSSCPSY